MRISDWSSDVCSSDLDRSSRIQAGAKPAPEFRRYRQGDEQQEYHWRTNDAQQRDPRHPRQSNGEIIRPQGQRDQKGDKSHASVFVGAQSVSGRAQITRSPSAITGTRKGITIEGANRLKPKP